jgi:DNA (cytosine-5)-methyltransferase 1
VPNDAQLADFFWFARIIYFTVDARQAHLQWLEHGSQIILQEMADPQELFLTMLCEDQPIGLIANKISVIHSMDAPRKKSHYFIRYASTPLIVAALGLNIPGRQVYNEQDISCTSLDEEEMTRAFRNLPPNNCLPCLRTDAYHADADCDILKESTGEGKAAVGLKYQGHTYHPNDFFLYNGGNGPAQIGYMEGIQVPRSGRALPKIQFTKVGRMGDLKGVQLDQDPCNIYVGRF